LVIGFTVVLFLNAILTPKYLQFGAVNASLIGHMFIVISGYYFSQRYYKVNFHFVKDGLIFLFFLGLSIAFAQFQFSSGLYQDIVLKILVLITIMIFVLVVFFQTEFRKTISFLNNIRYPRLRNNAVTNV
jgi:hypothetical protein